MCEFREIKQNVLIKENVWIIQWSCYSGSTLHVLSCINRYTSEAPEMQMRRMADLAFMFQLYEVAYQTYHTAKRDFNNDHAWLYYAGALVRFTCKMLKLI